MSLVILFVGFVCTTVRKEHPLMKPVIVSCTFLDVFIVEIFSVSRCCRTFVVTFISLEVALLEDRTPLIDMAEIE